MKVFPIGIRGKIFVGLVVLISTVAVFSALWMDQQLRLWFEEQVEAELSAGVGLVGTVLESQRLGSDRFAIDPFIKSLERAGGVRLTVIERDGAVSGDSVVASDAVATMENHGNRPEITAAFQSGFGRKKRFSKTIGEDMLYVARSFVLQGRPVVIRASVTLANFNARVGNIRNIVVVAGGLGLMVAVLVAAWASHAVGSGLVSFADRVRKLAEGGDPSNLPTARTDEIGTVARAVARMSADVDKMVMTLREERDRLEAILGSMDAGVIALDEEMRIIMINRFGRALFGLSSSHEGEVMIEVIRVPEIHDLIRASGDPSDRIAEFKVVHPVFRNIAAKFTRRADSSAAVLVLQDVTKARELEDMRRDFVANVSHELRTPLSVVRANAETLLDGGMDDSEHARNFVDAIYRNAERLSRLTTDLLDLSRIETGNFPISLTSVALLPVVERTVQTLEEKVQSKSLTVHMDITDSFTVEADLQALDQVLFNLVDNAIKYTPENGVVRVHAYRQSGYDRVEVEDDGPGIAPEHRARLFERFYRADAGRSRAMGGTGLGLAIVKHLMASMRGRVGMDPVAPHGSLFWLELPTEGDRLEDSSSVG